jgi:DNA polymerase III delta subunit
MQSDNNGTSAGMARASIFSGSDVVSKDGARAAVVKTLQQSYPSLVIELYDGTAESFQDYLQKMMMPTLFGDVRLFIVTHAETLTPEDLGELNRLLDALPDDCFLIVDIGPGSGRKSAKKDPAQLLQAAKRSKKDPDTFYYQSFQKPPDYKVAQWLVETVPKLCGRSIDKAASEYLVELTGYDCATLRSEVQKIDLQCDEGTPITREVVEATVGATRQMSVFELADACSSRDGVKVLEIIDSLFSTTCSIPMIISVLSRHYSALLRIRHYARANSADVKVLLNRGGNYQTKNEAAFRVGCAAGLLREGEQRKVYPVIIASGIVGRAQGYSDDELHTVLKWLLDFEVAVKTGRFSGTRADVEFLCFKLLRVTQLRKESAV